MSSALIQILVLAGVAVFLVIKLRAVLGTREGFEKPPVPTPVEDRRQGRNFEVIEGGPDRDITDHVPDGSEAARALAAMKLAEPGFSVSDFLQGARGAYEMILMAFETGDLDKVRPYLSPEVYETFAAVVAARKEKAYTVQASFIGLREMALDSVEFDRGSAEAEVTVRFLGELTSVTRDSSGQIIEGDPKAARKQRDLWTFARKMGANDPNWQLVATGE